MIAGSGPKFLIVKEIKSCGFDCIVSGLILVQAVNTTLNDLLRTGIENHFLCFILW